MHTTEKWHFMTTVVLSLCAVTAVTALPLPNVVACGGDKCLYSFPNSKPETASATWTSQLTTGGEYALGALHWTFILVGYFALIAVLWEFILSWWPPLKPLPSGHFQEMFYATLMGAAAIHVGRAGLAA